MRLDKLALEQRSIATMLRAGRAQPASLEAREPVTPLEVPAAPTRRRARLPRVWQALLTFVLLLVVWQASVTLLHVPIYILPPPTAIIQILVERWPTLLQSTWITAQEIVAGYLLAVIISIPLALAIAHSALFERTLYPVLVFSQIIPKIALAPLFVIWLGFGFMPKLLLTFLLCFFPIVVDGIIGFKSVDPEVMDFAHSTGASGWRLFMKIRLPQALPNIFGGLKVAAALAPVGAVVAEFVASDRGLGYVLLQANGDLNTRLAFADILILSTVGLALYFLVEGLERLVIPWHVSHRAGQGLEATL